MAQFYDNMAKNLLTDHAYIFSQFVLELENVEVLENIDTEQQTIIGQRTDSTKRIRVDNHEAILHIELQLREYLQTDVGTKRSVSRIPCRSTRTACLLECHLFPSKCWKK